MRQACLGMQVMGLKFDAILSSPYLRARQTAEIVAQVYKLKNKTIHLTDNLLPPASIENLLRDVYAHFPKSKKVLLVGHEPHLTEMISSLLKCSEPIAIDFKKSGLCCLSISKSQQNVSAILNWLLTPTQLRLIGNIG